MKVTTINSIKNGRTVIISGANGYFGDIACHHFISQGWRVLKAMRQQEADIHFDLDVPDIFAQQRIDTKVDLFIHAAGANEVASREYPYRSIFHNVAGTKAALDFCLVNGIENFVYLSTIHVFGEPIGIIDESTQPLPAYHYGTYGLSKLQGEEYVRMYTRCGKIKGMVIRPSNFFGIPVNIDKFKRWTLTPLSFCKQAVEEKKIVLKTPGFQQRNFVSVVDICSAIENVLNSIEDVPLLNLAGLDTLSIRSLAELVKKVMLMHLNEEIELILPESDPEIQSFQYTSCYLNKLYFPVNRIEDFLINFCQILKELSKKDY